MNFLQFIVQKCICFRNEFFLFMHLFTVETFISHLICVTHSVMNSKIKETESLKWRSLSKQVKHKAKGLEYL